jgi:CheY-like chemotaxis protein/ribosome-binding protein aMBF1 (putative translation factor)
LAGPQGIGFVSGIRPQFKCYVNVSNQCRDCYSQSIVKIAGFRESSPETMSELEITARFATSVRRLRFERGFSQEELAWRSDLHRTYIAGIEGGARNVSLKNIEKLAKALEVSAATLLLPSGKSEARAGRVRRDSSAGELVDILLVEDNSVDAELTLRALNKARFANHVHLVRDGAAALNYLFCRGEYSRLRASDRRLVVLLDLNLPKVAGIEVLRNIKANETTRKTPVVILTVSQKDRDISECLRLGAEAYIVKPVDFQRLCQVTPELSLNWGLFRPAAG